MNQKITYGVLGTSSNTNREVIEAGLNDTDNSAGTYLVPWYGTKKISQALEYVYDWVLDNECAFEIISMEDGRKVPSALKNAAIAVSHVKDVDFTIVKMLRDCKDSNAVALVMWDDDAPERSLTLAARTITAKIETLELTNGLVPVVIDEEDNYRGENRIDHPLVTLSTSDSSMPEIDDRSFDRETLEIMPAASVKRMAIKAGFDVRNKEEAINALTGKTAVKEKNGTDIGTVLMIFEDGTELGFSMNHDLLKKIMDLVIDYQSK